MGFRKVLEEVMTYIMKLLGRERLEKSKQHSVCA